MVVVYEVQLEDQGQDLLSFITDENGMVLEAGPFHTKLYEGALIPISVQKIGEDCMIHHPPQIIFGYLKYKVLSITTMSISIEERVSIKVKTKSK